MHPTTYGPSNQSGGIRVNRIFPISHGGTQGLALWGDRIGAAIQVVSGAPVILVMPISGFHIDLDQLEDETSTQ